MKGGRCVLATMRVGPEPFDTLSGRVRIQKIVFSTVGADRIKCLRPRALFQLPLLRVVDCRDATSIEARIRVAWTRHLDQLKRCRTWLETLGTEFEMPEEGSILTAQIAGERQGVSMSSVQAGRIILPSAGPLSGITLQRAEDRVLNVDPGDSSGVDVEIAVSNRLEELSRLHQRLSELERHEALHRDLGAGAHKREPRSPQILLVGPRLVDQRACIESLRLRDYHVLVARSQSAALEAFKTASPELVMVDAKLGRAEGIELIPALRQVQGVEEIPVVLVDLHRRAARREAARRMGAAGYLVYPIDVARIAKRLARMIDDPKRRRFTRYHQRVSVRVDGLSSPGVTLAIARGGMFLATDDDIATNTLQACDLGLAEIGESLRVNAEVLYRVGAAGSRPPGVGMRFHEFPDENQATLIRYLDSLEPSRVSP